MAKKYIFTQEEAVRVGGAVKAHEQNGVIPVPARQPRRRILAGACACSEVDVLNIFGTASSGQVTLTYVFNGQTDDVVLDYNSTASAAEAAYESHSGASTGDVTIFGGPWPEVALHVVYTGTLAGQNIGPPGVSDTLSGVNPEFRFWKGSSYDWAGY